MLQTVKTPGVCSAVYGTVHPKLCTINRPFGYKRVYLPLCIVADTPFYIQGDEIILEVIR